MASGRGEKVEVERTGRKGWRINVVDQKRGKRWNGIHEFRLDPTHLTSPHPILDPTSHGRSQDEMWAHLLMTTQVFWVGFPTRMGKATHFVQNFSPFWLQ